MLPVYESHVSDYKRIQGLENLCDLSVLGNNTVLHCGCEVDSIFREMFFFISKYSARLYDFQAI